MKKILSAGLFIGMIIICNGQDIQNDWVTVQEVVVEYPPAGKGYKSVSIQLPVLENEYRYQIEIFPGIEQETDCRFRYLAGKIVEKETSRVHYYKVLSKNTMTFEVDCPLDDVNTKKFITMIEGKKVSYNSSFPIVIHIPDYLEVRYKIWQTDDSLIKVQQ